MKLFIYFLSLILFIGRKRKRWTFILQLFYIFRFCLFWSWINLTSLSKISFLLTIRFVFFVTANWCIWLTFWYCIHLSFGTINFIFLCRISLTSRNSWIDITLRWKTDLLTRIILDLLVQVGLTSLSRIKLTFWGGITSTVIFECWIGLTLGGRRINLTPWNLISLHFIDRIIIIDRIA
jgi:hypothetical protein